ncbi:hypothetical protein ORQ94_20235 [Deinococcus sp. 43]|nr:hypothetical protein [Deinococcus sp. 43]GGB83291.1 hypothetical protein GCM10008019_44260 [Deinococcus soli (ex Cha et al. 2016)]
MENISSLESFALSFSFGEIQSAKTGSTGPIEGEVIMSRPPPSSKVCSYGCSGGCGPGGGGGEVALDQIF